MDLDWTLFGVTLGALFLFGIVYDRFIAWLGELKEGYLALFVVVGVLVTLLGVAVMDLRAAVIALLSFCASGIPMLVGDIQRTIEKRKRAIERMKDEQA